MKILLLEDDELFASSLIDFLEEEGFNIDHAKDGDELFNLNYEKNYDLYLLDINVPKTTGLELLKQLRSSGDDTPTIFLTSYKDKDTLKDGFKNGADDFLTKPIDLDELILRINALLKRSGRQLSIIKIQKLEFNPATKEIKKDDTIVKLPIKVIELFELFCEHRDSIVTKEQIRLRLWATSEEFSDGSVRVYINKIKQLLEHDSILNVKGVGYKIQF